MPEIRLEIPWDALASSNTRHSRRGGKAHSWQYKRARDAIHLHAMAQVGQPRPRIPEGSVSIVLGFYAPDFRRRDEANYLKALEDALQGVVYADDWQIVETTMYRREPDPDNPRVEVTITEIRDAA